jgi:hypothetical protein
MLDLGRVFVVGELPPTLPLVRHVHVADSSTKKARNARAKVLAACEIPDLSEDFLLMNDDFFMLEPFEGTKWPYYALKGSNGGTDGAHSFHVHCPIRINKEFYEKMPFGDDESGQRSPRTFYANFYQCPPTFGPDFVLRVGLEYEPYDEHIKGWPCFSVGDVAMKNQEFMAWLRDLYPEPSQYE